MKFNYRKYYETFHNTTIPIDENNIPYEIHHIDGDHSNNEVHNLLCVSIDQHYQLHLNQKDYASCILILKRKEKYLNGEFDKEVVSFLSSLNNKKRIKEGTHNFLKKEHAMNNSKVQKKLYDKKLHHFCSGQDIRGQKSYNKRRCQWIESSEEDFINLLLKYKFIINRKLRNGVKQEKINGMIIQALNCRYGEDKNKKQNILKQLGENRGICNDSYSE